MRSLRKAGPQGPPHTYLSLFRHYAQPSWARVWLLMVTGRTTLCLGSRQKEKSGKSKSLILPAFLEAVRETPPGTRTFASLWLSSQTDLRGSVQNTNLHFVGNKEKIRMLQWATKRTCSGWILFFNFILLTNPTQSLTPQHVSCCFVQDTLSMKTSLVVQWLRIPLPM